jgi:hypothetical protein
MIFILPLTFKRGKSSNFIQTKAYYMRKLIPFTYLFSITILTSCATYRNGQTPDDMYMASDPEFVSIVDSKKDNERVESMEERSSRIQIDSRQFRNINSCYCEVPSRLVILNNQFYCLTNGSIFPFAPVGQTRNKPTLQNNPTIISIEPNNDKVNYGKFSVPEYKNGSRSFPRANNNNNDSYPSSENNGGGRYFQSNSPSGSSGSNSTGGSIRNGRRN